MVFFWASFFFIITFLTIIVTCGGCAFIVTFCSNRYLPIDENLLLWCCLPCVLHPAHRPEVMRRLLAPVPLVIVVPLDVVLEFRGIIFH